MDSVETERPMLFGDITEQVMARARILVVYNPDAFIILKRMLQHSKSNSARPFLNSCMRIGRRLGIRFPEGAILASYTIWLENNADGSLEKFLGEMDYKIVFGGIFDYSQYTEHEMH